MKKRTAALLLTFVLIFGAAVGGTVAWLTAKTDDVVNTFTVGDINIDLWEHPLNDDGKTIDKNAAPVKANSGYKFVPGDTLQKDPYVVVKAGSEACYLFIKVTEENNTSDDGKIINYTISDAWFAVPNKPGYYYRIIESKTTADTSYPVLDPETVSVSSDVTKDMVADLTTNPPKITFTAAAIQYENIANVAIAFDQLPPDFKA